MTRRLDTCSSGARLGRARRARRSQAGVILLEALIAISILGTAVTAGLLAISTSSIATQQTSISSTASWVATLQMESIQVAAYVMTPGQYTTVQSPTGFTVQNQTAAVPGGDNDVQLVTVTVTYDGKTIKQLSVVKVNQ